MTAVSIYACLALGLLLAIALPNFSLVGGAKDALRQLRIAFTNCEECATIPENRFQSLVPNSTYNRARVLANTLLFAALLHIIFCVSSRRSKVAKAGQ